MAVVPLYACREGVQAVVAIPPVSEPGGRVRLHASNGHSFSQQFVSDFEVEGRRWLGLPARMAYRRDERPGNDPVFRQARCCCCCIPDVLLFFVADDVALVLF